VLLADVLEAERRHLQGLLPGSFAKMREGVRGIDAVVGVLRYARAPDQRPGEAVRVGDVVEAEAALHAQAIVVRRPVAAFRGHDALALHRIGDLAADAAIGAERIDLTIRPKVTALVVVEVSGRHQRAGGAGLHAFPAGHAGGLAHGVVEIEHHFRGRIAEGHADHVVDLHLAAAAHAQAALDAGIEIDPHGGMARIRRPALG
jgi:hypothetical protein